MAQITVAAYAEGNRQGIFWSFVAGGIAVANDARPPCWTQDNGRQPKRNVRVTSSIGITPLTPVTAGFSRSWPTP